MSVGQGSPGDIIKTRGGGKVRVYPSGTELDLESGSQLDVESGAMVNLAGDIVPSTNAGTVPAGITAVERGDGQHFITTLAVAATLPAIAGGAALAIGELLYTFPAGVIVVHASTISLAIQETEDNITADTPDGGLGTTIGSGANATLDAVGAAAENIMTGQTFDDCDGTAEVKSIGTQLVIEAAGDHTVYFNVADTWAASGDAAAGLAGTVVLDWSKLT